MERRYNLRNQLDYMMVLAGISGFIFLFLLCMKIDDNAKKYSFLQISFFSMILLFSDRFSYIYRGDLSSLGYWMVRICNFLVYASILLIENGFTNYLISLGKVKQLEKEKLNLKRENNEGIVIYLFLCYNTFHMKGEILYDSNY